MGQVCLAEGTSTYVKMEDVAKTLAVVPEQEILRSLKTKADLHEQSSERKRELDVIFKRAAQAYKKVVPVVVEEPLKCAEEMYKVGVKGGNEPYPFGEGGKPNGHKLSMSRFPTYKDHPSPKNPPPGWRRKLVSSTH